MKPPTELDGVYIRAHERWEDDPEAFERDDPLLARAFGELSRDGSAGDSQRVFSRRIQELEGQLRRQQFDRDKDDLTYKEAVRTLRRDLADANHRCAVLTEELHRYEDQALRLAAQIKPREAEQLSSLGWRKEAV